MPDRFKKKIVIVDLSVMSTSPAGSCVLSEIIGLSKFYEIHLFSSEVDNCIIRSITYHPVVTIRFPLFLRYIHFSIKVRSKIKKFKKTHKNICVIQTTQGQYPDATISYPHFCHKAYLKEYWNTNTSSGLTRLVRRLNHSFNAFMEAKAFNKAKVIVVPSEGLRRVISQYYAKHSVKIQVIPNPVDIEYYKRPYHFNRVLERNKVGLSPTDVIIVFVALGDFARKGLSHLIKSLTAADYDSRQFKILIVGGKSSEISTFRRMGEEIGISERLIFVGFQKDIRPFLWVSDIFALPSQHEIFPLAAIQAAAAGLPLLVSELYGVEEYIKNGKNGWVVDRDYRAIAKVLNDIAQERYDLNLMGQFASNSVKPYNHRRFRKQWVKVYENLT